jgi:hypothetical protein
LTVFSLAFHTNDLTRNGGPFVSPFFNAVLDSSVRDYNFDTPIGCKDVDFGGRAHALAHIARPESDEVRR